MREAVAPHKVLQAFTSGQSFTSGTTFSDSIHSDKYSRLGIFGQVGNISGTSGYVSVMVQTSPDNSNWWDHPDVSNKLTTTGQFSFHGIRNIGNNIRAKVVTSGNAVSNIGFSTPLFFDLGRI